MKPISINDLFLTGAGVGSTDLCPYDIAIDETIAGIDVDSIIGDGNLVTSLVRAADYKYNMTLRVKPGYFYITDKEFYYYNTKVTQFSRPIVTSGETFASVELQAFPDSIHSYFEKTGDVVPGGAAPLIVEIFNSGDLSNLGVIFDSTITPQGSAWGYGYRRSTVLDDNYKYQFVSGEPGDYPGYVSPLHTYEKCYESWFTDTTAGENEYTYDIETNRIIFSGDPSVICSKEVAIHWEAANEPFAISDINLNPVETLPENGIICLGLTNLVPEKISTVVLESNKTVLTEGQTAEIVLVARGLTENRISGANLICFVDFDNISRDGYLKETDTYLSGTAKNIIWAYSDFVDNPVNGTTVSTSGMIDIGDNLHCDTIKSKYMHMQCGQLSSIGISPAQSITLTTDTNGVAMFSFTVPSYVSRNYDARICCFDEDGNFISKLVIEVNKISNNYIVSDVPVSLEYIASNLDNQFISPDVLGNNVPLPLLFSPATLKGCYLRNYMSGVYEGAGIEFNEFDSFGISVPAEYTYVCPINGINSEVFTFNNDGIYGIFVGSGNTVVVHGTDFYERVSLNRRVYHGEY